MSGWTKAVGAITLFVDDPRRSQAFYESAFDLPVIHEDEDAVAFRLEGTILNLLRREAAPELIEPATVAQRGAGASFQLTMWVDDADAVCEEFAARGVAFLNGPIDRPWGVRTAAFADPDGHVWEVAQALASS